MKFLPRQIVYILIVSFFIMLFEAAFFYGAYQEQLIQDKKTYRDYGVPCETRPTVIEQGFFWVTYVNGVPVYYRR